MICWNIIAKGSLHFLFEHLLNANIRHYSAAMSKILLYQFHESSVILQVEGTDVNKFGVTEGSSSADHDQ
jgi:hypothetical protein